MSRADNVDISQRTAQPVPEDDEAEMMTRALERSMPYLTVWRDPVKRAEFVEGMRSALNLPPQAKTQGEADGEEEPFDQDKFFSDVKEMQKQIPKKL